MTTMPRVEPRSYVEAKYVVGGYIPIDEGSRALDGDRGPRVLQLLLFDIVRHVDA